MNPFDKITRIFYINLDRRTDRNTEMINEFKKMDITNFERFSAISHLHGCLGCSHSHTNVLRKIVSEYSLKNQYFLVLEDDFTFHDYADTIKTNLTRLFEDGVPFDVVLLASNTVRKSDSQWDYLDKCIEAQGAAGYLINGNYMHKLLANFEEGLRKLTDYINAGQPPYTVVDQYWKHLQGDAWYIFNPKLGYQRASYSDTGVGCSVWSDPQKQW